MTIETMLHLSVPETSYSSSEGEDDFYDANDDPFSSQVTTPRWVCFCALQSKVFLNAIHRFFDEKKNANRE